MDRRSFVGALGAALAWREARADRPPPVYISATADPGGRGEYAVAAFTGEGRLLYATRLPARGHDAVARPFSREVVVFARRPGDWAAIVDGATGEVLRVVTTPPERHFFGHGAFSPDGRLLYATENRIGAGDAAIGQGVLGIYDAASGYVRVDERPTFGPGPHDLAMLTGASGRVLVANGGTLTQPGTGREILNPDAMEPSLALVDLARGEAIRKVDLGRDLRALSIRHLALAPDGEAAFGCQWEGDAAELPALVGLLSPGGAIRMLDAPEDDLALLRGYVGSVALDASGQVVGATSPRGGIAAFWERRSGRYLGLRRIPDVCGIAADAADRSGTRVFLLTSGHAGVATVSAVEGSAPRRLGGADLAAPVWDNHLLAL